MQVQWEVWSHFDMTRLQRVKLSYEDCSHYCKALRSRQARTLPTNEVQIILEVYTHSCHADESRKACISIFEHVVSSQKG